MLNLRSNITKKLLSFYFLHENEGLYLNELVRRLDEDKRNLAKKLNEFEAIGLLKAESKGNLKIYFINKQFPLYKEYKKIILKASGIENGLKQALSKVRGIKKAFIFGSYATDKMDSMSDIDIMVIGEHSTIELQKKICMIQKTINREINLISISSREFDDKQKDPFIAEILKKDKVNLI
jgi:predicted nucleotidyltransferase